VPVNFDARTNDLAGNLVDPRGGNEGKARNSIGWGHVKISVTRLGLKLSVTDVTKEES
jgi:hypothetical protein